MLTRIIQGFCMALADSVPGVSGGTIAFIMGFYDKFIGSIEAVFYEKREEKIEGLKFLIKLGIGWVVGMAISISVLADIFDTHIYSVSSLFFGFILGAVPVIYAEEKSCLAGRRAMNILFFLIGAVAVIAISCFSPAAAGATDIAALSPSLALYLFLAGAVAICAMFLPGISGSTVLLILGLYIPIVSGVDAAMGGDFGAVPALFAFVVGAVVGALTIVKLIRYCLEHHRGATIALVFGLMIGSLYAVIVGPVSLGMPAMNFSSFDWIFFVIGIAIIALIQWLKVKKKF